MSLSNYLYSPCNAQKRVFFSIPLFQAPFSHDSPSWPPSLHSGLECIVFIIMYLLSSLYISSLFQTHANKYFHISNFFSQGECKVQRTSTISCFLFDELREEEMVKSRLEKLKFY